jgi:hypothetical protein
MRYYGNSGEAILNLRPGVIPGGLSRNATWIVPVMALMIPRKKAGGNKLLPH